MKTFRAVALVLALCIQLISACAPSISAPTPTPTPIPSQTSSPSPVPPTSTDTPVPPTSTSTPIPLILTDGKQDWSITSVTVSETSTYTPPTGFYLSPGFVFLTIEFEPQGNADMVSAIMQIPAAGIIKFSLPAGIKMVYVTDSENNKYHAVEVAQTYFIIPVKESSTGFTLFVMDWGPVELGK
jgi:hypothetical protein